MSIKTSFETLKTTEKIFKIIRHSFLLFSRVGFRVLTHYLQASTNLVPRHSYRRFILLNSYLLTSGDLDFL